MKTFTNENLSRSSKYLRTSEVAEMLGVTRQTVYAMKKRGELKAERIANRWMFAKYQVDEMLP